MKLFKTIVILLILSTTLLSNFNCQTTTTSTTTSADATITTSTSTSADATTTTSAITTTSISAETSTSASATTSTSAEASTTASATTSQSTGILDSIKDAVKDAIDKVLDTTVTPNSVLISSALSKIKTVDTSISAYSTCWKNSLNNKCDHIRNLFTDSDVSVQETVCAALKVDSDKCAVNSYDGLKPVLKDLCTRLIKGFQAYFNQRVALKKVDILRAEKLKATKANSDVNVRVVKNNGKIGMNYARLAFKICKQLYERVFNYFGLTEEQFWKNIKTYSANNTIPSSVKVDATIKTTYIDTDLKTSFELALYELIPYTETSSQALLDDSNSALEAETESDANDVSIVAELATDLRKGTGSFTSKSKSSIVKDSCNALTNADYKTKCLSRACLAVVIKTCNNTKATINQLEAYKAEVKLCVETFFGVEANRSKCNKADEKVKKLAADAKTNFENNKKKALEKATLVSKTKVDISADVRNSATAETSQATLRFLEEVTTSASVSTTTNGTESTTTSGTVTTTTTTSTSASVSDSASASASASTSVSVTDTTTATATDSDLPFLLIERDFGVSKQAIVAADLFSGLVDLSTSLTAELDVSIANNIISLFQTEGLINDRARNNYNCLIATKDVRKSVMDEIKEKCPSTGFTYYQVTNAGIKSSITSENKTQTVEWKVSGYTSIEINIVCVNGIRATHLKTVKNEVTYNSLFIDGDVKFDYLSEKLKVLRQCIGRQDKADCYHVPVFDNDARVVIEASLLSIDFTRSDLCSAVDDRKTNLKESLPVFMCFPYTPSAIDRFLRCLFNDKLTTMDNPCNYCNVSVKAYIEAKSRNLQSQSDLTMEDPKPASNITVEESGVAENDAVVGGSTPSKEATTEESLNETQAAEEKSSEVPTGVNMISFSALTIIVSILVLLF